MTVRTRIVVDAEAFDRRKRFINRYNELVQETVERVVTETQQATQDALRQDPGPVQYPIQWTSEKQRRWFWWAVSEGQITPGAPRTGKINEWTYEARGSGSQSQIVLENKTPYLKYVRGTLAKSNFLRNQQRFHRNTGWTAVKPIADDRIQAAYDMVDRRLYEAASLLGSIDISKVNR